jgi:hypothetical protein
VVFPEVTQHVLCMQPVTIIVNQKQVIAPRCKVCILDTGMVHKRADKFCSLVSTQCIINMHNNFNLMNIYHDTHSFRHDSRNP